MQKLKKKKFFLSNIKKLNKYKFVCQTELIKNNFKNLNFSLFFAFNSFNFIEKLSLLIFLKKNNLSFFFIPNKIIKLNFQNYKYKFLKNFLLNNILIIYNKDGLSLNKKILNELLNHKKLNLIFCIWNKKIYRAKQLINCTKPNYKIENNLLTIKYQSIILLQILQFLI